MVNFLYWCLSVKLMISEIVFPLFWKLSSSRPTFHLPKALLALLPSLYGGTCGQVDLRRFSAKVRARTGGLEANFYLWIRLTCVHLEFLVFYRRTDTWGRILLRPSAFEAMRDSEDQFRIHENRTDRYSSLQHENHIHPSNWGFGAMTEDPENTGSRQNSSSHVISYPRNLLSHNIWLTRMSQSPKFYSECQW